MANGGMIVEVSARVNRRFADPIQCNTLHWRGSSHLFSRSMMESRSFSQQSRVLGALACIAVYCCCPCADGRRSPSPVPCSRPNQSLQPVRKLGKLRTWTDASGRFTIEAARWPLPMARSSCSAPTDQGWLLPSTVERRRPRLRGSRKWHGGDAPRERLEPKPQPNPSRRPRPRPRTLDHGRLPGWRGPNRDANRRHRTDEELA